MKKLLCGLLVAAATSGFAAQIVKITFETTGPDCYKDGTTVRDGECYALVWVRFGTTFAGFLADGNVAEPDDARTLVAWHLAKDGRCSPFVYQADERFVSGLGKGGYAVCLLDTRGPDGQPMNTYAADAKGTDVPVAVNGYQVIAGAPVNAEIVADTKTTMKSVKFTTPVKVNTTAALPVSEEELKPVITSAEIKDGKFVVTVDNAVPYMKYDLQKGDAPDAVNTPNNEAQAGLTKSIELETTAEGSARFFKVTAGRNQ